MLARFEWDDPTIARLKELHAEHLSCAKIAAQIGTSRNSVIGKLHRLGLNGGGYIGRPKSISKPKAPRGTRMATRIAERAQAETVEFDPAPIDNLIPLGQRRTLLELTEETCRWPVGEPCTADFFFCGGPTSRPPYCAHHDRIAHNTRTPMVLTEAERARRVVQARKNKLAAGREFL